jgi:hypothetical protein
VGPSGDIQGRFAVDPGEDLGVFCCLGVEVLKIAKMAKMEEFGLDFCRVAFVSLVGPLEGV